MRVLAVRVPEPAAFLFHKGITFTLRGEEFKRDKDLFYLYFILRYAPDTTDLLDRLASYRGHELFDLFRENVQAFLGDVSMPGYAILGKFLRPYQDVRTIDKEITDWVRRLQTVL